jgi:arylformamidase
MLKTAAFAFAGLALVATAASAQQAKQRVSESCRAEIMKLCSAAGGDREARRKCMMENRSSISEGCRAELKARMDARKAAGGQAGAKPAKPEAK